MTPESFTYWLQGFVELSKSDALPNEQQWLIIKDHLNLVFDKKTSVRTTERDPAFEIKPTLVPTDWTKVSDLIGRKDIWPTSPYQITC